jgi:hypothetical protein
MCGEEQVFHKLLRDCGSAPVNLPSLDVFLRRLPDCLPIDSMMPVKSEILRRDHRVLESRRHSPEWDETIPLPVRRAIQYRLDSALDVHAGSRRVDRTQYDKGEPPRYIESGIESGKNEHRKLGESGQPAAACPRRLCVCS